jgi:hypothetical protein
LIFSGFYGLFAVVLRFDLGGSQSRQRREQKRIFSFFGGLFFALQERFILILNGLQACSGGFIRLCLLFVLFGFFLLFFGGFFFFFRAGFLLFFWCFPTPLNSTGTGD